MHTRIITDLNSHTVTCKNKHYVSKCYHAVAPEWFLQSCIIKAVNLLLLCTCALECCIRTRPTLKTRKYIVEVLNAF